MESNQQINFLDLSENRNINENVLGVYRKPTQTDIAKPNPSDHRESHKMETFNYMLDKVYMLPITSEEIKRIERIATNNGYSMNNIIKSYKNM